MKSPLSSCAIFFLFLFLTACNHRGNSELMNNASPARLVNTPSPSPEEPFKVKAKFLDFEMGDVGHYLFEDERGEIWDFTTCSDDDFIFEQSLGSDERTDFNKGWSSNKLLQGRWFLLECGTRHLPLYEGGPNDIAQVIEDATLLY